MGIPSNPLLDIMRRSLVNLDFVEANYRAHDLYEITQLVNTFLGAFIHPFEKSASGVAFIRHFRKRQPPIAFEANAEGDLDYLQFIHVVRHALAHGNLRYNANTIKQIESITLWNTTHNQKKIRITVSIAGMKTFLIDFKNSIEKIYPTK